MQDILTKYSANPFLHICVSFQISLSEVGNVLRFLGNILIMLCDVYYKYFTPFYKTCPVSGMRENREEFGRKFI